MRVIYPWLVDPYYEDKKSTLNKRAFLSTIDNILNQRQYVKITLLNWNEDPIKYIQGQISSGTMSKDGSSAARQTLSFSCNVSREEYDVEKMSMDYSINKKVFLEIGIKNDTDQYKDYPILWFPQGVFFIGSFSINSSTTSAVGISLQLKDKMAMLDGSVGGTISADTILDVDAENNKVKIYNIIQELVNHFGGEDLNNILIEDVPDKIRRIIRWCGEDPCYVWQYENDWTISESKPNNSDIDYRLCEYGDDIGYDFTDFVYDTELEVPAGSTVATALEEIKNYLGNFEFFYDEYGIFHFREIKNYLNNSQVKGLLSEMDENDYLMDSSIGKNVYTFSDDTNLISITRTPNYQNIRNDYVVLGISSDKRVVKYHLAIDNKPEINTKGYSNILAYKDNETGLNTITAPIMVEELPEKGLMGYIYGLEPKYSDYSLLEVSEVNTYDKNNSEDFKDDEDSLKLFNTSINQNYFKNPSKIRDMAYLYIYLHYTLEGIIGFIQNNSENNGVIKWPIDINFSIENFEKLNNNSTLFEKACGYYTEICKNNQLVEEFEQYINIEKNSLKNIMSELYGLFPNRNNTNGNPFEQSMKTLAGWTDEDKESETTNYKNIFSELSNMANNQLDFFNKYKWTLSVVGEDSINEEYTEYERPIPVTVDECIEWANNDIEGTKAMNSWFKRKENIASVINDNNSVITENIKKYACKMYNFYEYIPYSGLWREVDWIRYHSDEEDGKSKLYNRIELSQDSIDSGIFGEKNSYKPNEDGYIILNYPIATEERPFVAEDWRTELVLQGLQGLDLAVDKGYYYEELIAGWPTTYDMTYENKKSDGTYTYGIWLGELKDKNVWYKTLSTGLYFLDMIEPSSSKYGEYCVSNIGRRTKVNSSEEVNCLFEPNIPDMGFVDNDLPEEERTQLKEIYMENGLSICQVDQNFTKYFMTGGIHNSAFEKIKYDLLIGTDYQDSITISALPVFYLQPNIRIHLDDKSTNTYGDYMVSNISYTLGPGNPMSLTLIKTLEKI